MNLTKTTIANVVDALENGVPIATACKIGSISRKTFYRWQKDGKELYETVENRERLKKDFSTRESRLCEFYEKTSAALAVYELDLLKAIRSSDKWQAWAWILERRFREEYTRRTIQDVEAFLKTFEREHGMRFVQALQKVLDAAAEETANQQTFDEPEMKGDQLKDAAGITDDS